MIELRKLKFVWQLESVAFLWKHEFLSGGGKFSGLPKIFQQALDLLRERLVGAHILDRLTFLIQTKAIGARQLHVRVLGSVVLIEVGNLVDFIAQCSRMESIEVGVVGHGFLSGGGKNSGSPKIFQQALDLLRECLVNAHRA